MSRPRVKENPVTAACFQVGECPVAHSAMRSVVKKGAYAWSTGIGPNLRHIQPAGYFEHLRHQTPLNYLINRISSKYIVPRSPAAGLFLVPIPMVIEPTLVRSTPAKSVSSMTHSFHPVIWVAAASG